ncbi:nucleoside-diphosphate sugar epimerase/dehydratase [Polynucleobacter sp. UB-Siik-W21]|uniref:polysaccharide biosynthesis protein n=1 Tax=Polynucleobacter sp. UB-Siik-W21 TaxID=1855646 RepID=UPI00203E326C|nr:nucleoside-diphosphate sugar epimerase/dehydratase [Polynucleobacter sp. UB-Siik-W21]
MKRLNIKLLVKLPRPIKQSIVIFIDLFICLLSIWFAIGLRLEEWQTPVGNQWWAFILAPAFFIPIFFAFGFYRTIFRYFGFAIFNSIFKPFVLYCILFIVVFSIVGVNGVPRFVGLIHPILFFIGILSVRYLIRACLNNFFVGGIKFADAHPSALIYGAGSVGRQLAEGLRVAGEMNVNGFVDDDVYLQGNMINGVHVYAPSELRNLIITLGITDVLLAMPEMPNDRKKEIIETLCDCGVRVRKVSGLVDMISGKLNNSQLNDLDMNELLGREVLHPNNEVLEKNIFNKVVMVTGAGGSIGSELCRQIIRLSPSALILVDINEYGLYSIFEELKELVANSHQKNVDSSREDDLIPSNMNNSIRIEPYLASVRDRRAMLKIFSVHRPDTIFHAAAYKHVPLVEQNYAEGIRNNVLGTLICAQLSLDFGVSNFILISTDKAVRPTNIMGASKRLAELVVQSISKNPTHSGVAPIFSMVRFGNVLGSSGSVVPLFRSQIKAGGPITLTHLDVTRYFMTIAEAAQLVIQSSTMASGGDVFLLDMGMPVRIYDLALRMIYLSGLMVKDELNPNGDIEIKVTGLRPGEKLYEELLIGYNPEKTSHPKIMKAHEEFISWDILKGELDGLMDLLERDEVSLIHPVLMRLVAGYIPGNKPVS